jgi:hypothetical protein
VKKSAVSLEANSNHLALGTAAKGRLCPPHKDEGKKDRSRDAVFDSRPSYGASQSKKTRRFPGLRQINPAVEAGFITIGAASNNK